MRPDANSEIRIGVAGRQAAAVLNRSEASMVGAIVFATANLVGEEWTANSEMAWARCHGGSTLGT
jgi:hypothetical protein